MADTIDQPDEMLLTLTSDIVAAHVGNNSVAVADMPELIKSVYASLTGLGAEQPPAEEELVPAVSIRSSVKPDYIVCLEDGKKLKMLTRHLRSQYNLTPDQYRARWKLPADYPMTAPAIANAAVNWPRARSGSQARQGGSCCSSGPAAPKKRAPRKSAKSPT
jgi:predicted transcriptional regulator